VVEVVEQLTLQTFRTELAQPSLEILVVEMADVLKPQQPLLTLLVEEVLEVTLETVVTVE
jgi:hypothetical protein